MPSGGTRATPTRRRSWVRFARDVVIVMSIGVALSLVPGGKSYSRLGPWDSPTQWTVRYVEWGVAAVLAVVIASRHVRASRGDARRTGRRRG